VSSSSHFHMKNLMFWCKIIWFCNYQILLDIFMSAWQRKSNGEFTLGLVP
jgi:hypothetical protein